MDFLSFDWLFRSATGQNPIGADSSSAPNPMPAMDGAQSGFNSGGSHNAALVESLRSMVDSPVATQGVPGEQRSTWPSGQIREIEFGSGGPLWTFVTSRYALTLLVIGILVNRIQHICRPRGRPARLPSWKRLLLRSPAVSMLGYATLTQGFKVVQLWAHQNAASSRIAAALAHRVGFPPNFFAHYRSADRGLWICFLATCVSVATESLTRTIEGVSDPSPPSNLIGFALTAQSYQHNPKYAGVHYFLFIFLQVAEIFFLCLMGCWKNPPLRRLHITSFFGFLGTWQYLCRPSQSTPLFFGFDRLPDVLMLVVIVSTIFLHGLTMLLTEGKIQVGRLVFSRSNLPSLNDDYSLALFKLGTACLQSTRLNGLSRELVSIEVPEKTYIEVDDVGTGQMRIGLDGLLKGSSSRNAVGLDNEIRLTVPSARQGAQFESALLMSPTKWREVKRFFVTVLGILASFHLALYRRLPRMRHRLPRWMLRLPRWLRLVWHGQNGERQREERIARRRLEKERATKLREDALRAILTRNGVEPQPDEKVEDAAWRVMRESASAPQAYGSGAMTAEQWGVDPNLWTYLRRHAEQSSSSSRGHVQPEGESDEDEEDEDEDWELEGDGDNDAVSETSSLGGSAADDDDEGASHDAYGRSRRSRSRSRSVFSPTPTPEDPQDADESATLLQLARMDFASASGSRSRTGTPSVDVGNLEPSPSAFNQVLLAHVASEEGRPPLTRSQYRALVSGVSHVGSSSASSPSLNLSDDTQAEQLRSAILRRRKVWPSTPSQPAGVAPGHVDEDRQAERERLRLCVVCCYEERTILCWPCRCLALCDGCREELASRPGSGGTVGTGGDPTADLGGGAGGKGGLQNCPTCRAKVQGFSRVYLP